MPSRVSMFCLDEGEESWAHRVVSGVLQGWGLAQGRGQEPAAPVCSKSHEEIKHKIKVLLFATNSNEG